METKKIEESIDKLRKTRNDNYKKYIKKIDKDILSLKKERINLIIKNKEYIVDLSCYENSDIEDITAIDKNGKEVYLPYDEIIRVENGKLYLSSYEGGIVTWSDEKEKYIHMFHFSETELEIVGFIDIIQRTPNE